MFSPHTDCDAFSCSRNPNVTVCGMIGGSDAGTQAGTTGDSEENTDELCADGIDNDGNGFKDCEDFSCRRATDITVRQACQESVGETSLEVNQRCSDGVDNDNDSFIDCDDWDCSYNPLATVCVGQQICE